MSSGAARAYFGGRWHELGGYTFHLAPELKAPKQWVIRVAALSDGDRRFLAALGIRW